MMSLGEQFAAARALERAGEYDAAFSALLAANAEKFATLEWDEGIEDEAMSDVLATFSRDFIFDRIAPARHAPTPVFIVGMPRSGSTLVEQILATHPLVSGLGEVPYLGESVEQIMPRGDAAYYPRLLPYLTDRSLGRIRQLYLNRVPHDRPFFTDKMLSNFYHVGLVKMLFPHAKVIHCVRDPLDTCLSCFALLFNKDNLAFTYDLQAMGNYFVRYRRIMEHWNVAVPGFVFDFAYERVVEDIEGQVHRLLDFVGLPWHDECLRFYENRREVHTCSKDQVRLPIYRQSVGRALPFRRHLEPLRRILRDYV